jgi:hypothetical protein
MNTGENLLTLLLSFNDTQSLISDMRRMGYNVEKTPRGYVCHEATRYGKTLVLYAMKTSVEFRVKVNPAFFDVGAQRSQMVH